MRKFFFLFIFFLAQLQADEKANYTVLPAGQVHEGDYFAVGKGIEISGIVRGDVYAVGTQIVVDGQIEGSVIATGGSIEISGIVEGSVRLAGGQIEINGEISRNVTAVGGNIQINPSAMIERNVVLFGGIFDIAGTIKGDLTLSGSNARVMGIIGRNLQAFIGEFRIGSKAVIGGDLSYRSNQEAFIDPGAEIRGKIVYNPSLVTKALKGRWKAGILFTSRLAGTLMNFVFTFVVGFIFLKFFPKKVTRTLQVLKKSPWKSLGTGVLILFILPIACLFLFITVLGFPLALTIIAFSLLGFFSAKIFPILLISNGLLPKLKNSLWVLGLGLIAFFLLAHIPVLGALLSLLFTLCGLGALLLGRITKRTKKN